MENDEIQDPKKIDKPLATRTQIENLDLDSEGSTENGRNSCLSFPCIETLDLDPDEAIFLSNMSDYDKCRLESILGREQAMVSAGYKKQTTGFRSIVGMQAPSSSKKGELMSQRGSKFDDVTVSHREHLLNSQKVQYHREESNHHVEDDHEREGSSNEDPPLMPFSEDPIPISATPRKVPPSTDDNIERPEDITPRTAARKRRHPGHQELFRSIGATTPMKSKREEVDPKVVDVFVHILAEEEGFNLTKACPTRPFFVLFIERFGLASGQGFIASSSPEYINRVWRRNFTEGGLRAPHNLCPHCTQLAPKTTDQNSFETSLFSCPLCELEPKTWNSLRCHLQTKHAGECKPAIKELRNQASIC